MPNRNALLEVLADEFSSQAQKDQAQAGLDRLDHTKVVQVDLTAEPNAAAAPTKSGLWWEGMGMLARDDYFRAKRGELPSATITPEPDDPQWSKEAQYAWEHATFPEFYARVAKDRADFNKLWNAEQADKAARKEHIFVAHPAWRIRKEKSDYDFIKLCDAMEEKGVKWKLVDGVAVKFQNDKPVPVTTMPSDAAIQQSIAAAVASGGIVVDGTCRKSV
jgi:hypothetical protein